MRGEHLVTVRNNKVQIKLPIRRNLTILKGRSAIGKSTLIDLVGQFDEIGPDSGVIVNCDVPCKVLSGKKWQRDLESISGSIVFIDEDNAFMRSREFAHAAKNSDNYYVLVASSGFHRECRLLQLGAVLYQAAYGADLGKLSCVR